MNHDLKPGEAHPAGELALEWLRQNITISDLLMWQESFASSAIEGNRLAEICLETTRRLIGGEPVSDRYLLGLVWVLRFNDKSSI